MSHAIAEPILEAATLLTVDVVIPVLNEERELERSVQTVRAFLTKKLPCRWRIVVADNGSVDGTAEAGRNLARSSSDVQFVRLERRGRGRALRRAWLESSADIVCYMDVDLSTELEALPKAIRAMTEGHCDLAVGSRLLPGSKITRSLKREVISRTYNFLVKALLHTRFSDAQCGFKALTREVVETIVPQVRDESWFFDTELLVLAERFGFRIQDLPVVWNDDADSRVRILRTAWEDVRGLFRLRRLLKSRGFLEQAEKHRMRAQMRSAQASAGRYAFPAPAPAPSFGSSDRAPAKNAVARTRAARSAGN